MYHREYVFIFNLPPFSYTKEKVEAQKTDLNEIEGEFKNKADEFSKEREVLERKIADGVKLRQDKAKEMGARFRAIRSELTSKLVSAKSEARKEELILKKSYQQKVKSKKKEIEAKEVQMENAGIELFQEKAKFEYEKIELANSIEEEKAKMEEIKCRFIPA